MHGGVRGGERKVIGVWRADELSALLVVVPIFWLAIFELAERLVPWRERVAALHRVIVRRKRITARHRIVPWSKWIVISWVSTH